MYMLWTSIRTPRVVVSLVRTPRDVTPWDGNPEPASNASGFFGLVVSLTGF